MKTQPEHCGYYQILTEQFVILYRLIVNIVFHVI